MINSSIYINMNAVGNYSSNISQQIPETRQPPPIESYTSRSYKTIYGPRDISPRGWGSYMLMFAIAELLPRALKTFNDFTSSETRFSNLNKEIFKLLPNAILQNTQCSIYKDYTVVINFNANGFAYYGIIGFGDNLFPSSYNFETRKYEIEKKFTYKLNGVTEDQINKLKNEIEKEIEKYNKELGNRHNETLGQKLGRELNDYFGSQPIIPIVPPPTNMGGSGGGLKDRRPTAQV